MDWFSLPNNKQLTALGLGGPHVFGLVTNNSLELRGETAGNVYIAPDQIHRLRIGFIEAKGGGFYRTRLWSTLTEKPLDLRPTRVTFRGYTLVMSALAEVMIAADRREQVETGSSKFDALFAPVLIGIVTLGALVLALFVLTDEPWWGRMIIPLVPSVVFAILTRNAVKRHWPRALMDIEQLSKQLPPVQH